MKECTELQLTQQISDKCVRLALPTVLSNLNQEIERLTKESPFTIFKSDLDLLMKRYQIERSYLSQLADWYGNLIFWKKMILNIGIVGSILLTTIILHQLALFTLAAVITINILAFTICAILSKLLNNHMEVERQRCEQLCNDISALEENLKHSIQVFKEIQNRLMFLTEEVERKNKTLADYTVTLEKQMEILVDEIKKFKETIAILKEAQRLYNEETAAIGEQEQSINRVFTEIMQECDYLGGEGVNNNSKQKTAFFASFHATLTQLKRSQKNRLNALKEANNTLEHETIADNKTWSLLTETLQHISALDSLIDVDCEADRINSQKLLAQAEQLCYPSRVKIYI